MASQQQLKGRIGSVKNTRQITKAMELVAASKMRKAQENAFKGREYSTLAQQLLTRLRDMTDVTKHPLFEVRPKVKARLYLIISSDRGLAGAYNSSIIKHFAKQAQADRDAGVESYAITIGRQAGNFIGKLEHVTSVGAYVNFPEHPTANDLRPILTTLLDSFLAGSKLKRSATSPEDDQSDPVSAEQLDGQINLPAVDVVDVIYTDYKSSLVQEVTQQRLLPVAFTTVDTEADLDQATFEPSAEAVLNNVTQRFVEVLLFQSILESLASEHSARMLAMKSASDNASDIIDDLTLAFNTARQAAITQELAEITGGAEAIK